MNTRKTKKFDDLKVYHDAFAMVAHRVEYDRESRVVYSHNSVNQHDITRQVKADFHNKKSEDIKNIYKEMPEQYSYLVALSSDLNKALDPDDKDTAKIQQDFFIRICEDMFKDLALNLQRSWVVLKREQLLSYIVCFVLDIQLYLNLMIEEKRFLLDQHIKHKGEQTNGGSPSVQESIKEFIKNRYNEDYHQVYRNSYGSLHHELGDNLGILLKEKLGNTHFADPAIKIECKDLEEFEKDSESVFDDLISQLERFNDNTSGATSLSSTKATHYFVSGFLAHINNGSICSKERMKRIKQPIEDMKQVKSVLQADDKVSDNSFIGRLIKKAEQAVDLLVPKNNLSAILRPKNMDKNVSPESKKSHSLLNSEDKIFLALFGCALLGALAVSLFVCTGGLSALAYLAFHLIYVAPLVQGLVIAGGALLGLGLGFGVKKAVDFAGAESMSVKTEEEKALPVVSQSRAEQIKSQSPIRKVANRKQVIILPQDRSEQCHQTMRSATI